MTRVRGGPRSLLWRLGAFALAVTVISLALHVTVISIWLRPMGERLFTQMAARAQATRIALLATPASGREALAAELGDDQFLVARGAAAKTAVSAQTWLPAPNVPIGELLLARLGADFELHQGPINPLSFDPVRLRLNFSVHGEPWHIEARAQPPTMALLGTGVGWLVLAAAAVAASLLSGLRFIVGPIRDVADRIATQGAAMRPLAYPSGASDEVRSLVESFNRLAERVQAADRTKQQLLAGVSHDLRTPLARLRLRIETQCDAAVAEAAEPELRAVEHIVSQFLAFVHGDSGAGLGAETSMFATIDRVISAYAAQGIAVRTHLRAADERRGALAVQRLLENLIDNALAHGRAPVKVMLRESAAGERELSVWDHGPGLTPAQFESALAPFVRLSKDAAIGHCGLGLAIVAQIAALWGARIECRRDDAGRFGIVVAWPASPPGAPG
jgi:two-component system, OmpR family, osmolarity sensor histidine kinase EnvZ